MGNACGGSAIREIALRDVVAESHSQSEHPRRTMSHSSSFSHRNLPPERKPSKKYAYIPDNFHSLDQVSSLNHINSPTSGMKMAGFLCTSPYGWTWAARVGY